MIDGKRQIGDMKEGLTSARPAFSLIGRCAQIYTARGMAYGVDKYARGNFYGPPPEGVARVDRFLGYIDAALRHLTAVAQAVNVAKGTGGDQAEACSVEDDEASGKFPPSNLPHLAHAMASLMIAVEVGVADGLLPKDPGQPWTSHPMYAEVLARRGGQRDIPQKDDPDAERRRVVELSSEGRQHMEALREEFEDEFTKSQRLLVEKRVASGEYDVLETPEAFPPPRREFPY